jgi:hypothetical protein
MFADPLAYIGKGGTSMNHKTGLAAGVAVAASMLAGCAGSEVQTTSAPPPRPAVVVTEPAPSAPTVVTQPAPSAPVVVTQPAAPVSSRAVFVSPGTGGHWEMRGAGTPSSPYFWVWVPTGATIMTTAPPAVPQVVVTSPAPTIVTSTEGRWQLYGDGSRDRPYMWYWVPRGVTAPPPPAIYRPEG